MSNLKRKAVVIDTCFLRSVSHKDPDLNRLFEKARNNAVLVFIPEIALEEWRTQKVEEILSEITRSKGIVHDVWRRNIVAEDLDNPNAYNTYPTKELIDKKSRERMGRFLKENNIQKIEFSEQHAKNACTRYFECLPPFNGTEPRENRRKDIPDAWILEAALELKTTYEVHCLLSKDGDGKLADALEIEQLNPHRGIKEILEILDTPEPPATPPPVQPVTPAIAPTNLNELLAAIEEKEKALQIKIMGYVHWFAPITKTELLKLLEVDGRTASIINNIAERLALSGLITDTGNHYLPGDKDACEQAANSIMPEILAIIDRQ